MSKKVTVVRSFATQNVYGFWVGCLEYSDGKTSKVTNAFETEQKAGEVAARVLESAKDYEKRLAKFTPRSH